VVGRGKKKIRKFINPIPGMYEEIEEEKKEYRGNNNTNLILSYSTKGRRSISAQVG
jgi:hypothetical protein